MLVDTSVWVDHFRKGNATLAARLERGEVHCHPFVIGELACGNLTHRDELLNRLTALPQAPEARHGEVLALVETQRLMGRGIGWIDAHLLASARLAHSTIWTLDKRLASVARELEIEARP